MNRRTRAIVVVILLAAAAAFMIFRDKPSAQTIYDVNLLTNGSFDSVSGEGLPQGWLPDAYINMPGVSEYDIIEGRSGKGIRIQSREANDARFAQTVTVLPDTLYELSGYIKVQAQGGRGANLSLADVYSGDVGLHDTQGEWVPFSVWGKTARGQVQITVYARLGGYSAQSEGEASFDDLSLKAVRQVPAQAEVASWQTYDPGDYAQQEPSDAARAAWPWLAVLGVLYLWAAWRLAKYAQGTDALEQSNSTGSIWVGGFWILLVGAFLSRIAVAVLVPGYGVDIGCFTAWAYRMDAVGPVDFYITPQHSDYPPGYMLVLWPLGALGRLLGTGVTGFMVKVPALITDLAAIALIYAFACKYMHRKGALALTALFALNPLSYVTGPAWGQVDSLPALLLMAVILLAFRHQWAWALPVYVLSVLMKPQALMFGPLGLVALLVDMVGTKRAGKWRDLLLGLAGSLAVALAVVLPFSPKQPGWDWLIKLYGGTMGYYGYASVNATNLPFLFGLNWQPVTSLAPRLMGVLGGGSLILPTIWAVGMRQREGRWGREELLLLLALLPAAQVAALPMSLSMVGTLLMISAFLLIAIRYVAARDMRNLPLLGAVLLILFCNLGVMMHERYLFPTLILLVMAYIIRRDRKILFLLLACSVITYLNVGIVLDRGIRIAGVEGHLESPLFGIVSDSAWLEYMLSALQVLLAAAALFIGLEQSRPDKAVRPPAPALSGMAAGNPPGTAWHLMGPQPRLTLSWKDWAIMLGLTALYASLALSNLGSTKAPEQPWVSRHDDEDIILDLGEVRQFNVLYFAGIHWRDSDFEVASSDDLENWFSTSARLEDGDCFAWRYQTGAVISEGKTSYNSQPLEHSGRYVRVHANQISTTLMEMLFRDALTKQPIAATVLSGDGRHLVDEQDTLQGEPSWHNSMYFDEIYHARTAYEHLNAMRNIQPNSTYETSHPPLGKVLMSLSISIFGMTPFGWRFAGAMAGVLMLPAMYLLGLLLTRKRLFATGALLLLAFDTMHFTQTRIATIDSFVTLFIIWASYYMFRWVIEDGYGKPLNKTLPLLLFSGLFMGLGIASKWTGIYAGLGLAAIFFWGLWRQVLQGAHAQRQIAPGSENAVVLGVAADRQMRMIKTLLWCLLCFVAVPCVIYYVSFLPWFIRTPGGLTLQKVVDTSIGMFNYHSKPGLGMDHFYYSPWYEWPIIVKPMWFYSSQTIDGTSSTIITMGNPAIWWGGLAALLFLPFSLKWKRNSPDSPDSPDSRMPHYLTAAVLVLLSFLAQYLPWTLVSRGTYIYHYFPSVPFIILAAVLVLHRLWQRHGKRGRTVFIVYVLLCGLMFAAFFPYASGVRVSTQWLDAMKWFPRWLYY